MHHHGKLTHWNEAQGYGFASGSHGREAVFVHIKAFAAGSRRPVVGDEIRYEVHRDRQQRLRAQRVALLKPSGQRREASATSPALVFAALFCGLLLLGVWLGRLSGWLPAIYALASLITFLVYALDKHAARRQRWRTREQTLHLLALLGGWPGALLAQQVLRHKSSKAAFQTVFWGTVALNCGLLGWLCSAGGNRWLQPLALFRH